MIKVEDIVVVDVNLTEEELEDCAKLAQKTSNTWQANRDINEKYDNTLIGKLAEKALKNYLNSLGFFQCCFNKNNVLGTEVFAFYDDFRNDNFQYHNDIDLIFSENTGLLFYTIDKVKSLSKETNSSYFRLDSDIKSKMNKNGVFICEIKSTKITNRHRENGSVCLDKILKDDFLEYPKYCRKSNDIESLNDYLIYVNNKEKDRYKDLDELLKVEKDCGSDIYFRVYIESIINDTNKSRTYKAYIIGLIHKEDFFKKENITLKKMPQKNKSEMAIYFAVNLKKGRSVYNFFQFKILSKDFIDKAIK